MAIPKATKEQKEDAFSDILYGIMATDSDLKNRIKEISLKFSGNKVTIQVKNREDFKAKLETALFNAKTVAFKSVAHKSTVEVTQVDISNYQRTVTPYLNLGTSNVVFEYKDQGKGKKATTEQQENGAAYIFRRALIDNFDYEKKLKSLSKNNIETSKSKVLNPTILVQLFEDDMKELKRIFQIGANETFPFYEWLNSFYYSQKVLLAKYGDVKWTEFNRDGGFMDWISKYIKQKFGIVKKDTWNPADVWAIKGTEKQVTDYIEKHMQNVPDFKDRDKSSPQYEQQLRAGILKLNSVLIDLIMSKDPKVVGISLKLTDSGATIEEVNFTKVVEAVEKNKGLLDTMDSPFEVGDITCDFALAASQGNKTFTQDIKIKTVDPDDNSKYNFQIKANSSESKTGSNLKFEMSIQGKGAARGGKVPVELVSKILKKDYRKEFANDHDKFPRNVEQFTKKLPEYKTMFTKLKAEGVDLGTDYDTFVVNTANSLKQGGAINTNATCKLMGFEFLYTIYTLPNDSNKKQMRSLLTDMVFLSQKKNIRKYDTFGPFVKIS
jgi:hypothetical protein